jgi:hypothetical protein
MLYALIVGDYDRRRARLSLFPKSASCVTATNVVPLEVRCQLIIVQTLAFRASERSNLSNGRTQLFPNFLFIRAQISFTTQIRANVDNHLPIVRAPMDL